MRKYKKEKFKFLDNNGKKVLASEGDIYFNREIIFIKKYPFFKRDVRIYKLVDDRWILRK